MINFLNKVIFVFSTMIRNEYYNIRVSLSYRFYKGKKLNDKLFKDRELIVSMTSFPARFKKLHMAIESIYLQSYKPNKLFLYLDSNVDYNSIPGSIRKYEKYGLQIIIGGENIKPHKKYLYTMLNNPDSIVITIDDDQIYPCKMIAKLLKSYNRYPDSISCMRAHRITFNSHGYVNKYREWELECVKYINIPRKDLLATGIGGVLYPPHCMPDFTYDISKIKELCLNADDIWLKIIQLINKKKVVAIEKKWVNPIPLDTLVNESLMSTNVTLNKNDEYLSNLLKYFKINIYYEIEK